MLAQPTVHIQLQVQTKTQPMTHMQQCVHRGTMASARAAHGSSPLRPTNTLVLSTTLLLACVATAAATAPGGTSAADPYGPGAAAAAAARCPPPGFNTVPHLNLSAYISAPFYVQKQLPVSYQGEDPLAYLYCVRAVYRPFAAAAAAGPTQGSLASAAPQRATPSGLLVVENYANEGRVSRGPRLGQSGGRSWCACLGLVWRVMGDRLVAFVWF